MRGPLFRCAVAAWSAAAVAACAVSEWPAIPSAPAYGARVAAPHDSGEKVAAVVIDAVDGTLFGTQSKGFAMSKCATAAQVTVYAVDADGAVIAGKNAPPVHLASNSGALTVSKPDPSAPNLFSLVRRKAIPTPQNAVVLTATAVPHGGAKVKSRATVTFGTQICGVFTVYPVAAGEVPFDITSGPDGALWFTDIVGPVIGRITTSGVLSYRSLPDAASVTAGITAGPDGKLWFAENRGNAIGSMTTGGTVTEYPIPTASSRPFGIAAGADGALWFTENATGKIGRITTAGKFEEFSLPSSTSKPTYIAAGSDAAMWFGEYATRKLARIPLGATPGKNPRLREFKAAAGVNGVSRGTDGAMWFGQGDIGRIPANATSAAQIAAFGAGSIQSSLALTIGPDGAIWFADRTNNAIGRVAPDGGVREYAIPVAGVLPRGIAAGRDGAIWFAGCGGYVGRLQ